MLVVISVYYTEVSLQVRERSILVVDLLVRIRNILVLVVVPVDYEEGSFQVRERSILVAAL